MNIQKLRELTLPQEEERLYQVLTEFMGTLSVPIEDISEITQILLEKAVSDCQRQITSLYGLELWLYFSAGGPNRTKVDELARALSHLSPTNFGTDEQHSLASIKYHDLVTDYQYLFANGTKELKLAELMTKKLTVLSSAQPPSCVVQNIFVKVAVYYMLCGSDPRKTVVYRYLQEKEVFGRLPQELCPFVEIFLRDTLLPYGVFLQFIECLRGRYQFSSAIERQKKALIKNFMDCNMNKLPRYYLCMSFGRIQELLANGESPIDIQDFIYEMVMANKLAPGTKIDQVQKLVWFGDEPTKYDEMNARVKYMCDILNSM